MIDVQLFQLCCVDLGRIFSLFISLFSVLGRVAGPTDGPFSLIHPSQPNPSTVRWIVLEWVKENGLIAICGCDLFIPTYVPETC